MNFEYHIREEIFNRIMVFIRKMLYSILRLDKHRKYEINKDIHNLIPVMSYDFNKKNYRFNCYCFECPANYRGICSTCFQTIPFDNLHEFDGDNIIKNAKRKIR